MLEEVAAGSDWSLAWCVPPFADPTDPSPLGAMTMDQYAMAASLLKDYETVAAYRGKGRGRDSRAPTGPPGGGAREQKGRRWINLSENQLKAFNEWKKKDPAKATSTNKNE